VGDWPIKVYLQKHFNNQRWYQRNPKSNHAGQGCAKGKGKARDRDSMDDISDGNSGTGAGVESDVGDADATGDEGNDGDASNEDNSK